jgi:YHS domain-containing protein
MIELSRRAFISAAVIFAFSTGAMAQSAAPSTGARVALKGYDPVSYFTAGKPEQGSKEYSFAFDDTTYWFKSADHRDKFAAEPEHYAPQFDGYCAIQLSRGHKVEADPQAWAITNGKLYVFSMVKGIQKFHSESAEIIPKANENAGMLRASK